MAVLGDNSQGHRIHLGSTLCIQDRSQTMNTVFTAASSAWCVYVPTFICVRNALLQV